jgi:thiamine-monophosphate kinase
MLSGGEDYELLFTTAAAAAAELVSCARQEGYTLYPVGRVVAEQGIRLRRLQDDGTFTHESINFQGFDHFT